MTYRGDGPAARARQRGLELVGHDPVDFPFYGLDTSWEGPRYLHSFEVQDGRPLRALVLGHHSSGGQAWVLGASMPRAARDQWRWRDDEAREAADMVVGELLELMRPRESYRSDGAGLTGRLHPRPA